MKLRDLRPYLRFARYMPMTKSDSFAPRIPCDCRIFYTLDGEGEIVADNERYRMDKGSLIMIRAGVPYALPSPRRQLTYLALNFDMDRVEGAPHYPLAPQSPDRYDPDRLVQCPIPEDYDHGRVCFVPVAHGMRDTLELMIREYSEGVLFHEEKCSSLLSAILFDIARMRDISVTDKEGRTLEMILGYIVAHAGEELSAEHMASIFSFHPNYLSALIKRSTGMPLHRYLLSVRLKGALNMLDSGERNIAAVAEKNGFYDTSHFSRAFKREYGLCPTEYVGRRGGVYATQRKNKI